MTFLYLWSKLIKKIRGSSILGCKIDATAKVEAGSQVINSVLGRYSFCGYDCFISHCDIQAFTSISNNVKCGGARHPMEWVSMSPVFYAGRDSIKEKFALFEREEQKRTWIGNDVWIGEGVFIKEGVRIGDGAVVGMGSVVTRDVEPYTIVAGNPAQIIRKRFDVDTINLLVTSEWWNWSIDKIKKNAKYFNDISLFINNVDEW